MGLADRGDVETAAHVHEQLEDFRRRIGLHRVVDAGVRQRLGERLVVLADDLEVEHEARAFILASF
jgi:hypothetical protein